MHSNNLHTVIITSIRTYLKYFKVSLIFKKDFIKSRCINVLKLQHLYFVKHLFTLVKIIFIVRELLLLRSARINLQHQDFGSFTLWKAQALESHSCSKRCPSGFGTKHLLKVMNMFKKILQINLQILFSILKTF